jgi:predicted Zn-dependent protease
LPRPFSRCIRDPVLAEWTGRGQKPLLRFPWATTESPRRHTRLVILTPPRREKNLGFARDKMGSTKPSDRTAEAHKLSEKFPDNDLSRFNLAQAYFDVGDPENAAEHLRPLCAKKSDWMVVRILLGESLIALGGGTEAKPILEHALQLAIAQHHDGPREELEEFLRNL